MICHRHLANLLSLMGLTAVSLSLFLVDYRIKSTGTLAHPKASFGPALELRRSPRPRVFCQHAFGTPGGTLKKSDNNSSSCPRNNHQHHLAQALLRTRC